MEAPEHYLRALTAPLPAARFSAEAVAHAFVILGLLPVARAEEILAAQRAARQAAGVRLLTSRVIGELSVSPAARGFRQARAGAGDRLHETPLAATAGPVRCRLRGQDLVITSATLTPEGIRARYHGDAREGDDHDARAWGEEIIRQIRELSVTDDAGHRYLVSAGHAGGHVSGRRLATGGTLLAPEGEFLAVPAPGPAAIRWLEFSAGSGPPARAEIVSSAAVLTGTAEPPWPTPAECYLAQFAPPARDWSLGSLEAGPVELDTAAIVTAVTHALLAVGALPPDSAVLAGLPGSVRSDWRLELSDRQLALMDVWRGPARVSRAGLAARLPFERATAVIESITAREDMVSIQLYGYPWVIGTSWPMITPCFRVTAADDTGVEHEGGSVSESQSPAYEGSGTFWFWPAVGLQAKQLRVTVSTLWEAAWAVIDIPGR